MKSRFLSLRPLSFIKPFTAPPSACHYISFRFHFIFSKTLRQWLTSLLKVRFSFQIAQGNPDQFCTMMILLDSRSLPQLWYFRLVPWANIYASGNRTSVLKTRQEVFDLFKIHRLFLHSRGIYSLLNILAKTAFALWVSVSSCALQ